MAVERSDYGTLLPQDAAWFGDATKLPSQDFRRARPGSKQSLDRPAIADAASRDLSDTPLGSGTNTRASGKTKGLPFGSPDEWYAARDSNPEPAD